MAETEITNIKLTLTSNIKKSDVEATDDLLSVLEKLDGFKLKDGVSSSLATISKSLSSLNGIKINANLGKGISGLADAINGITDIKDITPYASNLSRGFSVLANAAKNFEKQKVFISPTLGRGITGLVDATNEMTKVSDITPFANRLDQGFSILAKATNHFSGNNAKIGVTLGRGITGIVEAINSIENIRDITPHAHKIESGFRILSSASQEFENNMAKIPVGLGRGISGLLDVINSITNVKDLTPHATQIEYAFALLAQSTRHFDNMNTADYSGISRLIDSMSNIGKIKAIDNTIVKNAEKLAQAINVLDKNTNVSTQELAAMGNVTSSLSRNMDTAEKSTNRFGTSLRTLNIASTIYLAKQLSNTLRGLVRESYKMVDAFGEVENTLSFFSQSLGDQASQTANIIQTYADIGAVDFTEFADQVAKLNQVYTGYGISAENAAKMALNMTQLAYDASYALGENGKDIALWNQRATSVATGQTRSGYYFGVDTSVKALSESFDELDSNSNKATRSMAAYNAMIDNTQAIQGQLAREFGNTYVQMTVFRNRVTQLKQSIGAALIPLFNQIIRAALVTVKVVEMVINAVFRLFGKEFKLINYAEMITDMEQGTAGLSSAAQDVSKGFNNANKAAQALRKTITGIDQVFTIDDSKPKDSSPGGIGGIGGGIPGGGIGGYDWLEDLASAENLAMLDDIDKKAQQVFDTIKRTVPWAATLGAAFAGWKIANSIPEFMKDFTGFAGLFEGGFTIGQIAFGGGLLLLLGDLDKLRKAIKSFIEDGPTFDNVTSIISSFIGTIGDLAIMAGQTQVGAILKMFQGVSDVVFALYDMTQVGISWDNVTKVMDGLSNLAIGVGILKGNWALVGTGVIMQGGLRVINEIKENWEAIKEGDWSGVDKVTLAIGGLQILGGFATAMGVFSKLLKKASDDGDLPNAPEEVKDLTKTTKEVSDGSGGLSTETSNLTSKMTTLVKNLALGIVIIAEVAAAALLIVGAIWAMGKGLEQVGIAWKPVIADGKHIATSIAIGTGLLVGIGVAVGAIGTLGTTVITPLAIGTGILVALTAAVVLFIEELKLVANRLSQHLAPAMANLNEVLPDLTEDTRKFTLFMIEFAGHVVAYSTASAVAGIAGTIDTIIGWFTKDPIKKMADDAKKNGKQFDNLVTQLEKTNPLVKKGNKLLLDYMDMLEQLHKTAKRGSSLGSMPSISTDFKAFSKDLKDGFKDLQKVKTDNVSKIMSALNSIDLGKFRGIGTDIVKAMELGINNYTYRFTSAVNKIKQGLTFSTTRQGQDIAKDVVSGINNSSVSVTTFKNKVTNALKTNTRSIGTTMATDVISGINARSVNVTTFKNRITNALKTNTRSIGSTIGGDVVSGINSRSVNVNTFRNRITSSLSFSSYSIGSNIARGVQNGINGFRPNLTTFNNRIKNSMQTSFRIYSPSRWARDMIGFNIAKGVEGGVNETPVVFDPFKNEVLKGLSEVADDATITPRINMPEIDSRAINGDLSNISSDLSARVEGEFKFDNDGTEKAVKELIHTTRETNERLVQAIDRGQVIVMDGDKVGKTAHEYSVNQNINNNRVF